MPKQLSRETCVIAAISLLRQVIKRLNRAGQHTECYVRLLAEVSRRDESFAYSLLVYKSVLSEVLEAAPFFILRSKLAQADYMRAQAAIAYYEERNNVRR